MVGLVVMMVGKIFGCIEVIVVDIVDLWLEFVKELGVIYVINSKEEDLVEVIKKLMYGYGVDFVVDMIGVELVMVFVIYVFV